jgi:hypothetical protein
MATGSSEEAAEPIPIRIKSSKTENTNKPMMVASTYFKNCSIGYE